LSRRPRYGEQAHQPLMSRGLGEARG
jgi:hypothetical protein